jgi:transposase-like protein
MAKPVLSAPHFHNEEAAFAYMEAHLWPDGPVCPHCGNVDAARIGRLQGKSSRPGLRKCYACRKTFTVRIGSIFEDSHFPLHLWLQAIHLICQSKKGISTRQIQRAFNCSMKTAWFLMHRIRACMGDSDPSPLGGAEKVVEGDETFVGGKARNRAYREPAPKQAVVSLVERSGKVRSRHVPTVTADRIRPLLEAGIDKASHFRTDESNVYLTVGKQFASHETVNHSAKEYVRDDVHTNTVEGFFSILKRGVYGVYQHVSAEHLHRYLAEFDFRYSNRAKLGADDLQRASFTVQGAKGRRLTYETTRSAR